MAQVISSPTSHTAAPAVSQTAPILSFPAILRNPGLTSRFAHLTGETLERAERSKVKNVSSALKKHRRDQNDGKRWIRRKDNAQFAGNPHVVAASKKDYTVPVPQVRATFPEPLPPYLPRTVKLPNSAPLPATDPLSANAGRFSLSMKGMRRELRRQGGRAEALVTDIEGTMMRWLVHGGTVLAPGRDVVGPNAPMAEGMPIGNNVSIMEVSRTPLQLVWRIPDDAFARYVVHCCARYHEIVSFSKGDADDRLTYLLRPNVTRPDRRAPAGLDTPPATDLDYSSNPDIDTGSNIDSDFVSDRDFESDVEGAGNTTLRPIDEAASQPPNSPRVQDETWSLVGDTDADVESSNEMDLETGVEKLSLSGQDPEQTFSTPLRSLHRPYPLSATRRAIRSSSSPSRSPIRVRPTERRRVLGPALPTFDKKRSFYEFVFR